MRLGQRQHHPDRYQSTNDRAYHKALSQLLRLRSDRQRSEIGFESQKARNQMQQVKLVAFAEAQQARQTQAVRAQEMKEELHAAKLRRAEAHANDAELEDYMKRTMEAPMSGEGRVDIEQVHEVVVNAIRIANAESAPRSSKKPPNRGRIRDSPFSALFADGQPHASAWEIRVRHLKS